MNATNNSNMIIANDGINTTDSVQLNSIRPGLYARTQIIGGYDPFKDERGVTQFGEKLFEAHNMIVLGGSLFTLEKVFGIPAALNGGFLTDNTYHSPVNDNTSSDGYIKDTTVCLFGVGTGGADNTITNVHDVRNYEQHLRNFIPFRVVANGLTDPADKEKYFYKKEITSAGVTKIAYYLKTFESTPSINVYVVDAENLEGVNNQLQQSEWDAWSTTALSATDQDVRREEDLRTVIELTLKITTDDLREYFIDNDQIEQTRFNTFGLFTGCPVYDTDGVTVLDYKNVRLFSKLNIPNEMLVLNKDLTILYRIYTS